MAASVSTDCCEVLKDEGISESDMKSALSSFLKKKNIREMLSEDDHAKLARFQNALEQDVSQTEQKKKPIK